MAFGRCIELEEQFKSELALMTDYTADMEKRISAFSVILAYILRNNKEIPVAFLPLYQYLIDKIGEGDYGSIETKQSSLPSLNARFRSDNNFITLIVDDYGYYASSWIILITTDESMTNKLEIRRLDSEISVEVLN